MVDLATILFIVIEGILAVGVPVILVIYLKKKRLISWKPVLVGILVFAIFSQILEQLLHLYMFEMNSTFKQWLKNPYLYAIYGGLAAGVFEEAGRYIGFRYLLRRYREWKDGITYGIGHGGIEAILIGGLTSISLVISAYMVNSGMIDSIIQYESESNAADIIALKDELIDTPAYMYLISGFERIFAFTHHLGYSLLVLCAVRNRKAVFLLYAILAHAGVNFVASLYQKLQFNIFIVEVFNILVAIIAITFIVKSKKVFDHK